jgi:hypothetical protein
VFIILFFLLTVYALLIDNQDLLHLPWLKRPVKLLDAKTACTLFATFLGMLLIRNQFIIGSKPRLIYSSSKVKPGKHPEFDSNKICRQVKLVNAGLGAASFSKYEFRMGLDSTGDTQPFVDFASIIQKLQAAGFILDKDYFLTNITSGGAMSSKEEKVIFELVLPPAHQLVQLDLRITFEGYIGGRYVKDIFLIPRAGIPGFAHALPKNDNKKGTEQV